MKKQTQWRPLKTWGLLTFSCLLGLLNPATTEAIDSTGNMLGGPTHIGTFEGSTKFTTSSSNGINPGLYLEVMDEYGNYTEYTSEEGVITLPDTQEGAYITQAKLLGKTKYVDQDTGEILDQWEDGRHLKLESSKMPVLTTTGKNLIDNPMIIKQGVAYELTNPIYVKKGDKLTFIVKGLSTNIQDYQMFVFGDTTGISLFNSIAHTGNGSRFLEGKLQTITLTASKDGEIKYFKYANSGYDATANIEKIMLCLGEGESYEPYKSNILTTNEDIELRGIRDVQDMLDLITGAKVERIGEVVLDGSQDGVYDYVSDESLGLLTIRLPKIPNIKNDGVNLYGLLSNKYNSVTNKSPNNIYAYNGRIMMTKSLSELELFNTSDKIKLFLSQNPITLQYPLATPVVKTVVLNSTYEFPPVATREILVKGSIVPLICSVTTPTEPLSFVLNPNLDEGQRFIAPDFTIRNQTPSAVTVELKQFKQTTTDLKDVLPSAHADWNTLDKTQSKDIALALVPKASDGWQSLIEGPRYVADPSNYFLGTIKSESSVDFTFEALHGRAFTEALSPQYHLVVVFGF